MHKNNLITTVNYHFWKPCNMRCKFCYATFEDIPKNTLPKGHLSCQDSTHLINMIAEYGFKKINFAGGEPTLCPWLPQLVSHAHKLGLQTSLITNGYKILKEKNYLNIFGNNLDIIGISIDSMNLKTNISNGRAVNYKEAILEEEYLIICQRVKEKNIMLKINTVVSVSNYEENMTDFINTIKPDRWKILQMLAIEGQNDIFADEFKISEIQFETYSRNNEINDSEIKVVLENNEDIRGSYVMINPSGQFFDNIQNKHSYSEPILKVGIHEAFNQINTQYYKFILRGGSY